LPPVCHAGRCEKSDVARLAGAFRAGFAIQDGMAADQPGTQLSHRIGFGIALLFGAGFAVLVGDGDVDRGDADAAAIVMEGIECGEAGLSVR
jgi:hypothetical protein